MGASKSSHLVEIRTREAVFLWHLEPESGATLAAAAHQGAAAGLGLQACAEPVRAGALLRLRLVGSTHSQEVRLPVLMKAVLHNKKHFSSREHHFTIIHTLYTSCKQFERSFHKNHHPRRNILIRICVR